MLSVDGLEEADLATLCDKAVSCLFTGQGGAPGEGQGDPIGFIWGV